MSDYKELIGELKEQCSAMDYDCCELAFRAADAIEQLAADNYSYREGFADLHNELANLYETVEALEKERDAAVDDLEQLMHTYCGTVCFYCKHYNDRHCDDCVLGDKWQWQGAKEVDDG